MKYIFCILFSLILLQNSLGQHFEFISLEVGVEQESTNHLRTANTTDTLTLPFIDDFTTGGGIPNPKLWLSGSGVITNTTTPVSPPNVSAAVFDGLDETGTAYRFSNNLQGNTTSIGTGDDLFSKPIDLSSNSLADSIRLSFYYQLGGLDEVIFPDVQSLFILKLFFKNKNGVYDLVWPASEDEDTLANAMHKDPFTLKTITIRDSIYLHDGFQFRFQVYGSNSSNVDTWSVDYVYLDQNRADGNVSDIGFSSLPSRLLKEYQSIPAEHFLKVITTYLQDSTKATVKNTSINDVLVASPSTVSLVDLESGTTIQTQNSNPADFPANLQPGDTFELPFVLDKNTIESTLTGLAQNRYRLKNLFQFTGPSTDSVVAQNDSVSDITILDQYYAYDDGSAEYAAGVGNSGRSFVQIAYVYNTFEADTLSSIFIHFPKYAVDLSSSSINIKVWKKLEGIAGASTDDVLYSFPFPITYVDTLVSGFHEYELTTPILLDSGQFYIGFEHSIDSRVYFGVDASSNTMTKVYTNIKFQGWGQEFLLDGIAGNIMMRPKFGKANDVIGAFKELPLYGYSRSEGLISVYPNPSNGWISFSRNIETVEVYNQLGEFVTQLSTSHNTADVSQLEEGLYFLRLLGEGKIYASKFVLNY